jgi:glycosyltransferase involved in cell wall biosynthesis
MTNPIAASVIIPAYNAAEFLPFALKSLQAQTWAPAQVIVVDDGSTDATATVAEQHGAKCLRQAKAGPGAARNRGLAAATTDYVAFLDADDWYALDKLERSLECLVELNAAAVATDAWLVRGDKVERRKNDHRIVPSVLTMELLLRGNPIVCSTVVCRRQAILDVGGFDENPDLIASEDYDLWLRMANVEPFAYLAEPLTFYRVHEGSLSANPRFLRGVDRILDKVLALHAGEAHFENLVRRRRAELRCDVAWDMLREGKRQQARSMLAEARGHMPAWKVLRMWLRSFLPVGGR